MKLYEFLSACLVCLQFDHNRTFQINSLIGFLSHCSVEVVLRFTFSCQNQDNVFFPPKYKTVPYFCNVAKTLIDDILLKF